MAIWDYSTSIREQLTILLIPTHNLDEFWILRGTFWEAQAMILKFIILLCRFLIVKFTEQITDCNISWGTSIILKPTNWKSFCPLIKCILTVAKNMFFSVTNSFLLFYISRFLWYKLFVILFLHVDYYHVSSYL